MCWKRCALRGDSQGNTDRRQLLLGVARLVLPLQLRGQRAAPNSVRRPDLREEVPVTVAMEDHLSGCPVCDLSGTRVRREYHSGLTGLSVADLDHRVRHRRRPQLILACGHGRTLYGKVEWYVDNGSGLGIKPCGPENGGAQCHREGLKWFHRSLSFSSYLFPQVLALRNCTE